MWVSRVYIQDPGVIAVDADLCDLFAHNSQPPTPRITWWGISSGWVWLVWSWWSLGCCCSRLDTALQTAKMQPGGPRRRTSQGSRGQSLGSDLGCPEILENHLGRRLCEPCAGHGGVEGVVFTCRDDAWTLLPLSCRMFPPGHG